MAFEQSYQDDHHYVWRNVVRAAETDLQGVVFYGEYVTYQDETATAYLRDVGYPYQDIGDDWDMHVVNVDINYRSTASMGDELVNGLRVAAIRDFSIEYFWRCRSDGDAVIAEGGITYAAVAAGGGGRRVSASFRDAVVAYQDVPPDPV
jgi:acyl-CoA thioester hydrolase